MKNIRYIYPQEHAKMKKLTLTLFLACLLSGAFAQAPFPTEAEMDQFFNGKTYVVLENSPFSIYNSVIKKVVEEYWTVTDYEFIDFTRFEQIRTDPAFSFIILTQTTYSNDRSSAVYNFINLLVGKDVRSMDDMPEMIAIPLSYKNIGEETYTYKLNMIVQFMQQHALAIREDPSKTGMQFLKYYNKNVPQLKEKTLLINKADLAPELQGADLSKIYEHPLKVVEEAEIVEAIENKTPDVLILHKVGPEGSRGSGMCFKMFYGVDDARIYFYGEHKISDKMGDGLLERDLKRMARF